MKNLIIKPYFDRVYFSSTCLARVDLYIEQGPLYWKKNKLIDKKLADDKKLSRIHKEQEVAHSNDIVVNSYKAQRGMQTSYSALYDENTRFDDPSYKETLYQLEGLTKRLFFPDSISDIVKPNWFRSHFRTYYQKYLNELLKDNHIYSCILKVRYQEGEYRTIGRRFGFLFNHNELMTWNFGKSVYYNLIHKSYLEYIRNVANYKEDNTHKKPFPFFIYNFDYYFRLHNAPLNLDQLYLRICGALLDFLYEYDSPISYFVLSFTAISNTPAKVGPKNINNIKLKPNFSNIAKIRRSYNSNVLPLTLDESTYGKRRSYSTKRIYEDEKIRRIVTDLSPTKTQKEIFDIASNTLIDSFIDEKITYNSFIRTNAKLKTSITIQNENIIKSTQTTVLPLIRKDTWKKKKDLNNTFNKNIGSFDLETYYNTLTDKHEVYAVGFAYGGNNVMIDIPKTTTFYLDRGKTSSDIIVECIKSMLVSKYNGAIFYTHNLGGFDVVFILKILAEYNKSVGSKFFSMSAVLKENRILKLKISAQTSKTVKNSINLVDSLSLLPNSLSSLSKSFSTEYEKPYFPYTFVTDKTLYYKGVTPSIDFYASKKGSPSLEEYNKLVKQDWCLRDETLEYLDSDLISLLQIMYEFSREIFEKYKVKVSECLTITGVAVKIFLAFHDHKQKPLGLLTKSNIYSDIKQAYYGGLSEVYNPYGEDLYYYDVNSLYPYAALNDMPGNICTWIESHNENSLDLEKDKLFGFFYCKVTAPENYLGYLPLRWQGLLTHPVGSFSGWWFTAEIENAIENGYKVQIIKGYSFNRVSNVFDKYIQDLYNEKKYAKGSRRLIAKLLLNSLLGRFGMILEKRVTSLLESNESYLDLITKYEVFDEKIITKDLILATHGPEVSKTICEQHGLNFIDFINSNSKENNEFNTIKNVSVGVSAAVTAYSTVHMNRIKKSIIEQGGKLFYTDTDSIVTDIKLSADLIGSELGQFKLEHKVLRGYFISSKLYCIVVLDEGSKKEKVIIKSKGIFSESLTEEDFKKMLNGEVVSGTKSHTVKSLEEGTVSIGEKQGVQINSTPFRKRMKIFDSNKKWVGTSPIVINESLENPEDEN